MTGVTLTYQQVQHHISSKYLWVIMFAIISIVLYRLQLNVLAQRQTFAWLLITMYIIYILYSKWIDSCKTSTIVHRQYNNSIRHDPRPFKSQIESDKIAAAKYNESNGYHWGVLLPITSRGLTAEQCWGNLHNFCTSLAATTSVIHKGRIIVYVGIDEDDKLYQQQDNKHKLRDHFAKQNILCNVYTVSVKLSGKVCQITNLLAQKAIQNDTDFVVLLGDDIKLLTDNWVDEIEAKFKQISLSNNIPFGIGCVAFYDTQFPGFPTFPVIHKTHFAIFEDMFPATFSNQGGDPYLFAIYKRFNASLISEHTKLSNTIGGIFKARYNKQRIEWKTHVLSSGVKQIKQYFRLKEVEFKYERITLDVIVPTFRCDMSILHQILSIDIPTDKYNLVTFIIVIDNPLCSPLHSDFVRHFSKNKIIRVIRNETNLGASISRNIGIENSDSDFILFLDDDVTPNKDILKHYYDAIINNPDSNVFVGCTKLPTAYNLWTTAVKISRVSYFYDIATKMMHPPWGVTANLCVKSRTYQRFDPEYPKSGGGEDIDFCLQHRETPKSIVSVPRAVAQHPWWNDGNCCIKHICGWAKGESLCLRKWPEYALLSVPNIPEFILLLMIGYIFIANSIQHLIELSVVMIINIFIDVLIQTMIYYYNDTEYIHRNGMAKKLIVCIVASFITFAQESTRLIMHIHRGNVYNLCFRFDFMGTGMLSHHYSLLKLIPCITCSCLIRYFVSA